MGEEEWEKKRVGERARLSAEGTADGSGLAGTMPPPSTPRKSTHSEGGGAKVRGIDWQSL